MTKTYRKTVRLTESDEKMLTDLKRELEVSIETLGVGVTDSYVLTDSSVLRFALHHYHQFFCGGEESDS